MNILNQILEDKTHRTLTPIALSLLIYITIGLTIGLTMSTEKETTKMITIFHLTLITNSSKLDLVNTHNQISEDKTQRTPIVISPSLPTYITTGPTTGLTMSIEKETTKTITTLLSISTTNSDWC